MSAWGKVTNIHSGSTESETKRMIEFAKTSTLRARGNRLILAAALIATLCIPRIECSDHEDIPVFWLTATEQRHNLTQTSTKLADILRRVGPSMRASADYHDFQDVNLEESAQAWRLLHDEVENFTKRKVSSIWPRIERLLTLSNVSQTCHEAMESTFNSMKDLNSRSVQMWSATGSFPPVGLFDGQFTDIGSYRGCVDIPNQDSQGYASYCLLPFRPIVPSRKPYHRIFEKEDERMIKFLLNNPSRKHDVFRDLASFAQYFHYVYLQTGVCVPSSCSPADVQQVASFVAGRLYLMAGPVRCFTRSRDVASGDNKSSLVRIEDPVSRRQAQALAVIVLFYSLVVLATIWHIVELFSPRESSRMNISYTLSSNGDKKLHEKMVTTQQDSGPKFSGIKYVALEYFSVISNGRQFLRTNMKPNEIKCLHGFRVLTMCWIICVHTLQYNQWSGFTRIFENVRGLQNPVAHPIYNANYVVDNFFLMSGLLASYTTWNTNKGTLINFNFISSLIGRYLRLTPQVLLVSLLYIVLPLISHGPFWFDMTHDAARYCERNWWVNLLHLQTFYRKEEMCNLVGWWISVDMFYYIIALGLLYLILSGKQRRALVCTSLMTVLCMSITAYKHFMGKYPPNNLGVVPQIGEVWTSYVVEFFWSPFPHAFPFYIGLWLGYVMANNKWVKQVRRWSRYGWLCSFALMASVSMSSYIWMSGWASLNQSQFFNTIYNISCTTIWSLCFGWMIIACHYGCARTFSKLMSLKLFVLMSKASFIVYLSHMLVIRAYFGMQNSLIEVSIIHLLYITIGNTFLSTLLGVFLCITFEGPVMKFQRYIYQKVNPKSVLLPLAGFSYACDMEVEWSEKNTAHHGKTEKSTKMSNKMTTSSD